MNIKPKTLFVSGSDRLPYVLGLFKAAATNPLVGIDVEFRPQEKYLTPEWAEILSGDDQEAIDNLIKTDEFKKISFDPRRNELVTLQIGFLMDGQAYAIVFDVQAYGLAAMSDLIRPFLLAPGRTLVAQNAVIEYMHLKYHCGIEVADWHDTMLHERVLNAGTFESNGLGAIRARYLPEFYTLEDALEEKETTRLSFIYSRNKPISAVQQDYAARDATDILFVLPMQHQRLHEANLEHIAKWEDDIIPAIGDMELTGVRVNTQDWLQIAEEAREQVRRLHDELQLCFIPKAYKEAMGGNLNGLNLSLLRTCDPNSPLDMLRALKGFGYKENIGGQKKMVNGKAEWVGGITLSNTNDNTLLEYRRQFIKAARKAGMTEERIAELRKPIDLLIEHREWSQRVKTFGESWIQQYVSEVTGRVHCHFNQYGADSGRMSCQNPNMQQIPSRGDFNERYRHCIIPSEGCVFVNGDWSQLEMRILAAVSGDPQLIDVFQKDRDLHTMSAALFLNQSYEELLARINDKSNPRDQATARAVRTLAKTVGFGVAYGMGPKALSVKTIETDPDGMGSPAFCDLAKEDFQMGAEPCDECARCALMKFQRSYAQAVAWLNETKKEVHASLQSFDMAGGRRTFTAPNKDKIRFKMVAELLLKVPEFKHLKRPGMEAELEYEVTKAINSQRFFRAQELDKLVEKKMWAEWGSIEREGANHPIQGTNARMLKIAMRKVWERIKPFGATILLVIHDEFLIEVPREHGDAVRIILEEEMINAAQYFIKGIVPTPADAKVTEYWAK